MIYKLHLNDRLEAVVYMCAIYPRCYGAKPSSPKGITGQDKLGQVLLLNTLSQEAKIEDKGRKQCGLWQLYTILFRGL